MSYLALYRKYRPQSFDEVVEQETVVRILKQALKLKKISHAYLFAGPKGSGKTTLARIFAKGLNCSKGPTQEPCLVCENCTAISKGISLDVMEIDAASNRGIDEIRELKDKINYVPINSRYKVYIIDEAHMLTTQAFNALLKTLEEPPSAVVFILATTEPDKIPPTIMSRCEHFFFKPISLEGLQKKLAEVAMNESINISDSAINLVARVSSGSLRNALSLLEQIATLYEKSITDDMVRAVLEIPDENFVSGFVEALIARDAGELLKKIDLLKTSGKDPKIFLSELVEYMNDLITGYVTGFDFALKKRDSKVLEIMKEQSRKVSMGRLVDIATRLLELSGKLKLYKDQYFPIVLTCLKILDVDMVVETGHLKEPKQETKEQPLPVVVEPQKEPTGEPQPQGEKAPITIEDVNNRWDEIRSLVKTKSVPLFAQLTKVNPVELKGDLLVLDPEKNFYLTMLRKPENVEIIENAIKSIMATDFRIMFLEHEENAVPKEQLIEEIAKKKEVQAVLKLFDGTIVDVKDAQEEE